MAEKKPGQREKVRAAKEALRSDIGELRDKISAALSAPRVPGRVLSGDVRVAQQWKDDMEKGDGLAYHISNNPSKRLTADKLAGIKAKLQGVLTALT